MDELTRLEALRFWEKQVMDPKSESYGDIAAAALATFERFFIKDAFQEIALALKEEITRHIRRRDGRAAN